MRDFLNISHQISYMFFKEKGLFSLSFFYVDYYLYKIHIKKDELVKKTDLIIHANFLYYKYFKRDDNRNSLLDLPPEKLEKIEKKSKDDFCFPRKELYTIYDEAYTTIKDKLYTIYYQLMKNKNEVAKVEKILEYTELDEIKEEVF